MWEHLPYMMKLGLTFIDTGPRSHARHLTRGQLIHRQLLSDELCISSPCDAWAHGTSSYYLGWSRVLSTKWENTRRLNQVTCGPKTAQPHTSPSAHWVILKHKANNWECPGLCSVARGLFWEGNGDVNGDFDMLLAPGPEWVVPHHMNSQSLGRNPFCTAIHPWGVKWWDFCWPILSPIPDDSG